MLTVPMLTKNGLLLFVWLRNHLTLHEDDDEDGDDDDDMNVDDSPMPNDLSLLREPFRRNSLREIYSKIEINLVFEIHKWLSFKNYPIEFSNIKKTSTLVCSIEFNWNTSHQTFIQKYRRELIHFGFSYWFFSFSDEDCDEDGSRDGH